MPDYGGTLPPITTTTSVPPSTTTTQAPAQPDLAYTGSSVIVPALLGGIFLAALGAALLRWARRNMPTVTIPGYAGTAYDSSPVSDGQVGL